MNTDGVFGSGFDQLDVGDEFETRFRTIREEDLSSFSDLTGDHHPLHTDPEWAARSPFGERIAHGMLLLSCSVGLAPIDPDRVVALRGFDRVVFKRPVRIGDSIALRGRVEALKEIDDENGLARFLWKVVNDDERTVLRANADIVWRRVAPAPEPVYL
jgi:3-hydroxybutyryl-CoA dehydratase